MSKPAKRKEYDEKKFLYFDFNKPEDVLLHHMLEKVPRKTNKFLSIMLKEFMEHFGINENITKEDLKKIIDNYEFFKQMKQSQYMGAVPMATPFIPVSQTQSFSAPVIPESQKEPEIAEVTTTSSTQAIEKEVQVPVEVKAEDDIPEDYDELMQALSGFGM